MVTVYSTNKFVIICLLSIQIKTKRKLANEKCGKKNQKKSDRDEENERQKQMKQLSL